MIKGLGVDIVEIDRIKNSCEKYGDRFLERVFTPFERDHCLKKKNPYPSLAARFAVKEAAFKALGTGVARGISWQQVEVKNDEWGKPMVTFSGVALELAQQMKANNFHVTISHSRSNAVAQVILEEI